MLGLQFWSVHPYVCTVANAVTAQLLVLVLCRAAVSATLSKLGTWIKTAGVTAGAGINGLAIYSAAGALLGQTGDMTTAFSTGGYQEGALTSGVPVVAGTDYYLAFLANFTGTAPVLLASDPNINLPSIRSNFSSIVLAAQASFPASFTPSGLSLNNAAYFLSAGT